jgi:NAD(P)-dependent dehydrogenase (short-subunit alcohol dehydrogenase family)
MAQSMEDAMGRHSGKVAVCAGSATGMGAETALRLAREGAQVVIGDVNVDGAKKLAEQIAAEGGEALGVEFDIVEEASVQALIAAAVARFGRLDAMHVNATDRKLNRQDGDALSTGLEVFDRMIQVSLRGHLLCTRAAIPEMLKTGGGAIVYTSSGISKSPGAQRVSYQVAKSGLNGLMRHVATRWGPEGIRANAITPGLILTDAVMINTSEAEREQIRKRTASTRLGSVQDIAALTAFLLSDEAEWINGQAISIDGGSVMQGG